MKNIFLILCLLLTSCERYVTEIPTLTLSGEYKIDRLVVRYQKINFIDSNYLSNSVYVNSFLPQPFDTIKVDEFRINLDYSTISFSDKNRSRKIPYNVFCSTPYKLGYLTFDLNKDKKVLPMIMEIKEDGSETLVLKGFNSWPVSTFGPTQYLTFYLRRVGP